jgi:hypothetical protein
LRRRRRGESRKMNESEEKKRKRTYSGKEEDRVTACSYLTQTRHGAYLIV